MLAAASGLLQREQYGRRGITFLQMSTANTTSTVGSVSSTVISDAEESSNGLLMRCAFCVWSSSPKRDNHSAVTLAKLEARAHSAEYLIGIPQNCTVIKAKLRWVSESRRRLWKHRCSMK